jgi:hypothetical protein
LATKLSGCGWKVTVYVSVTRESCTLLCVYGLLTEHNKLYIGTANINRQWVRKVQKMSKIRLSIAGESFDGTARFLTDRAEHERAMAAIRRKYWMFRPVIALGRVLTAMGLMHDNTGSFEVTLARVSDSLSEDRQIQK